MKRRSTSSRTAIAGAIAFAAAAVGADCEGSVIKDPTFRDWCGDSLCAWTRDAGSIARVPTWNESDFGVSFVATGTQISQVTSESDAKCLVFTTVADIDPSADMHILVDFDNDGTTEFDAPLGATDWHKVETEITAPASYQGITFHLRKEGSGTAILAEMRVVSTTGCVAPAPVVHAAFGEPCNGDGANGCADGLVCNGKYCGQCDENSPCPGGARCASQGIGVLQCAPGQFMGQAGAPCLLPADCASGVCDGASVESVAAVFGQTDAGCVGRPFACDAPAADGGVTACTCYVQHGGTCL
jgi:hypothetical protein